MIYYLSSNYMLNITTFKILHSHIIVATNKNELLPYILNKQNAHTGNVAPATGTPSKLLYISFIVLALLKYLIQYISYKTINTNAIKRIIVQPDISLMLKSLNINDKQVTNTSPILSNSSNIYILPLFL